jgi:hypothetical protein
MKEVDPLGHPLRIVGNTIAVKPLGSATALARPGRQRLGAGSPVEDAGSLHELLSTDISLGEALSEDLLGVLFR